MKASHSEREQLIGRLDAAVGAAEEFFRGSDENLRAGEQSARETLAHLIFWHLEYVHVAEALVAGQPYALKHGTTAELNAMAARQVRDEPMPVLARRLSYRQKQLSKQLRLLSDWSQNFPAKAEDNFCAVSERIARSKAHIRAHVACLRRAAPRADRAATVITLGTVDAFALPGARHYLLRIASA